MFNKGQGYSREDIHNVVGGSIIAALPTQNNVAVALCLRSDWNPRAPEVFLCGRGPAIEPSCERFAIVKNIVPVFVKEYANRWIYMGRFKPVASYTSGDPEFERHIEGSIKSVNDISRVIILESV